MTTRDTARERALVYVHGGQCQPAPETLLDLVLKALEAGVARDRPERVEALRAVVKRLAYYGDRVNAVMADAGDHYDEVLDVGDCRNALQALKSIEKPRKFSLANYDRLPGKSAMPELAAGLAGPILSGLGLSGRLVGRIVPVLNAYWQPDGVFARATKDAVRVAITDSLDAGEHLILVSHGVGSIVTWDVLWELTHVPDHARPANEKIDTWLTLGAPLGDTTVRKRLAGCGEKGRRRYPGNVVTWHNVSAEDDWLSHDNTLADDFRAMLKQRQVSAIRDYRVYNLAVRYGRSDPHCALGYLVHPRVAQIVGDWLERPLQAGCTS